MNGSLNDSEDATQKEAAQRFFNGVLAKGVVQQVRLISIEPTKDEVVIFFRAGGIKKNHVSFPIRLYALLVGHLLNLVRLEKVEAGAARIGRFAINSPRGDPIDVRVSFLPTQYGDRIDLRFFWPEDKNLALSYWWKDIGSVARWVKMLEQRGKIVFIGGPADSGKTTTLYASLTHLKSIFSNIISLEDPVDYPLEGVRQIAIERDIMGGLADAIRSVTSCHPDVLAVSGPMKEDLRVIFDFAKSGASVIVELGETSPLRVLSWLKSAGISHQEIADVVMGVVSQNLIRQLCRHCAQPLGEDESSELDELYGADFSHARKPMGCDRCGHTGFSGRELVYSLLEVGGLVKPVIASGNWDDSALLTSYSDTSLSVAGLNHVRSGTTTIEELEMRLGRKKLIQAVRQQKELSESGTQSLAAKGNARTVTVPKLSELKASYWQSAQRK